MPERRAEAIGDGRTAGLVPKTTARRPGATVAVLLAVMLIALAVPIRGSEAQSGPTPASSEVLFVRMALRSDVSIRTQTVNVDMLWHIFSRWGWSSSRLEDCGIRTRYQENRYELHLTVTPSNPARRADCSDQITNFVLRGRISEREFIVARSKEAENAASWVNPDRRYPHYANLAAERLAFLSVYKEGSPLHEVYAISEADYTKLTFDSFNQWLEESRREGRLAINTAPKAPEVVDLAGRARSSTALPPSTRVPAGTFSFDGERFGIAGLVLLKIPIGYNLRQFPLWKRLSCNDRDPIPGAWAGAPASIASIACFADRISESDSWFVLALRKDHDGEYSKFCRDIDVLTHDPDLMTLIRALAHEPYLFLSPRCEEADGSQSTVPK